MSPQSAEDSLLQDRLAQLKYLKLGVLLFNINQSFSLIVNRRNEFLRELFCLLRNREDINTTSIDDEDEELGIFLKRFDLGKG